MWILKWILGALLIIVILGFALQNQEQTTYVRIIAWKSIDLPLYFFLYIAYGAGILTWLLVSIFNRLKLKGNIHKLQRENRKIKDELNRLRNASIEDEEPSEEDQDKTEIAEI